MRCRLIHGILIILYVSSVQCMVLEANVHLNGIKGTVRFSQNGGDTNISIQLTGVSNPQNWSIRKNRMTYLRKEKCTDTLLGTNFISSNGSTDSAGQSTDTITTTDLPNLDALTGRSILLVDSVTSIRTCATIENEKTAFITATAKLQSVIGGNVYFRQASWLGISAMSAYSSMIYTNVFHLQNTETAVNESVSWGIYTGTCANVGELFNPTSITVTSCDQDNQVNCKVGDLSSKHSNLTVGEKKDDSISSYVDTNLPLDGTNSIVGNILVLRATNGTFLTCSKIVQYTYREVSAVFSRDGVKGHIQFSQLSPFDETIVMLNLNGLQNLAGGYHVHKWPVPEKWASNQNVCSDNSVSGHFNPFEINTATDPAPGVGTNDQYEVGDLSGKFGLLTGLNETIHNYKDFNLPLFGTNSITGRSIVIHHSNGDRWVCSTINYPEASNITSGVAMFTYPAIGYIVFKQNTDIDLEIADTMIYIELNYGDTTGRTVGHNWHVHVNKMMNDFLTSTGRCMSVLGHYNPFSVDLDQNGNYNSECGPKNPLRCEVGDLSKKHGQIAIRTLGGTMERNFFTDVDLPLTGDVSIIGRSIVIHGANSGSSRFSCANIYPIPTRKVIVESGKWSRESTANVDGTFTMTRKSDGLADGLTKVEIQLAGLSAMADGYHVHVNPLPPTGSSHPCSPAMVGGHFNPFGVSATAGPIDGTGTDDEYEVGDLSRKYGKFLNGETTFTDTFTDTMLPLRGPLSVTGRSIVIHKSATGGARWVCGNITEDTSATGGTLFEAKATFSSGIVKGFIYLTQYIYSDGGLSDTGVLVDLYYTNGTTSPAHNWHVHQNPVGESSDCMSTGPHYNPFMVNTTSGYDECTPTNPLRCELGDQASKLARYDIGSGRKFFTDVNLPIIGEYSVIGKSFVIHSENGGGPRIACADIMPENLMTPILMVFERMNFDKTAMVNHLAHALNTSSTNLAVSAAITDGDCMSVNVFVTGMDAQSIHSKLITMTNTQDKMLGAYAGSVTCCSCIQVASILLCVVAIMIQRLLES